MDTRRPAHEMHPIALRLAELLRPAALRVEIAGSLRRGKETIGDIEIVAVPLDGSIDSAEHSLCQLTDKLLADGVVEKARYGQRNITRWATRLRGMMFEGVKCELFIADTRNFGYIEWLRTGPDNETDRANTVVVSAIKRSAPFKVDAGRVWMGGQMLKISTEREWFNLLGLPYLEPKDRTSAKYKAFFSSKNHHWGRPADYRLDKTRVVKFQDVVEWWDAAAQRWLDSDMVYIGRSMPSYNLPASPYGNPIKLDVDTPEHRLQLLEVYKEWLHNQPLLVNEVEKLQGKSCVCWCHPKICHGDVLSELADRSQMLQQQAFRFDQFLSNEWKSAVKTEERSKKKAEAKPKRPPFQWGAPWQTPDGDVWVYAGYGDFDLLPQTDPRAVIRRKALDKNPVLQDSERKRLLTWLELKRATEAQENIETVVESLIALLQGDLQPV